MAGQSYVLDKTYTIDDAAGVGQFLAVVAGAADGGCKKPAAENAAQFLGFTQEAQANQNKGVVVRKLGISRAVAAGVITQGDYVNIAGSTGKVQSCHTAAVAAPGGAAANLFVLGVAETTTTADGDIVMVMISPQIVKVAAS